MVDIDLPLIERDAFYAAVWIIVRQIPSGRVTSYGQVASYIPCPKGVSPEDYKAYRARWVGNAMSACPADVPWQRVINSQGKISLRGGADRQRRLLEAEGVLFDSRDRVDMKRFGWEGLSAEWLRNNGFETPDDAHQLSLFS